MGEKQVEPTRVEMVCFSQVEEGVAVGGSTGGTSGGGGYWMATLDTWIQDGFATERHIKFWRYRNAETGSVLVLILGFSAMTDLRFGADSSCLLESILLIYQLSHQCLSPLLPLRLPLLYF